MARNGGIMKKEIITLCMVMVVVFSMANIAFADTTTEATTENRQISNETEQFLYGDWKIKSFLGLQMTKKADIEYPGEKKILGKVVAIAPNIFSTRDFAPEFKKYVVNIWVGQYNLIDSLTGKEFTSKYKVSENVTKIKDSDRVQVIQAVPENKNDTNVGPMLVDINNERLLICLNCDYFELGKNFWSKNDMDVGICSLDVFEDGFYHVYYHSSNAELVPEDDRIRLLMIDGGLVPYPDIKVVNDRTLVPLRLVSELLGAKVDWDEKMKTIVITEGKTKISLTINSAEASINDNVKTLDVPPVILDGKTYVPVRFIAEALAADVGYISSFGSGMEKTVSTVSVVTIEKPDRNAKVYSIEEGLVKVKEASIEEYKIVMETFKGWNGTFDDNFKDYDAQDIFYTNQTCGRYYVYRLTAFPERNIFFNKYTGELYSECCAGSNFLEMRKGFTDISWGYQ